MPGGQKRALCSLTISELKEELRTRDLPVSGNKNELLARLLEVDPDFDISGENEEIEETARVPSVTGYRPRGTAAGIRRQHQRFMRFLYSCRLPIIIGVEDEEEEEDIIIIISVIIEFTDIVQDRVRINPIHQSSGLSRLVQGSRAKAGSDGAFAGRKTSFVLRKHNSLRAQRSPSGAT
ncbi:hypothetical protein DMN91_004539 [Ooceraea biroi]|uniref:SAP domain-containing protein n=1 Tax=Ooceraea biroi TaxID=2015173 RepID=A0A3L8DPG9_OOCBI|nr:hypothetical protein DMN91_004539 [Ooceraea biroi]